MQRVGQSRQRPQLHEPTGRLSQPAEAARQHLGHSQEQQRHLGPQEEAEVTQKTSGVPATDRPQKLQEHQRLLGQQQTNGWAWEGAYGC